MPKNTIDTTNFKKVEVRKPTNEPVAAHIASLPFLEANHHSPIKAPKKGPQINPNGTYSGNTIAFGNFALQALEPCWLSSRQIEAGRRVMTRYVKRTGQLWIRVFPDKAITIRPAETRMGSGKGSPDYWVAVIQPGKIIYEIDGVPENIARGAMKTAAYKMPIKTKFLMKNPGKIS